MATFGRIPLCFHCDVRGAIAYCNNSGGFSERFSIDPVEVPWREMRTSTYRQGVYEENSCSVPSGTGLLALIPTESKPGSGEPDYNKIGHWQVTVKVGLQD
jgi:hypothetical protein